MGNIDDSQDQRIDPDPISVSMLFIAAATLVLQFIEVAKSSASVEPPRRAQNNDDQLIHLEDSLKEALDELESIIRSIERGSHDVDKEFFDIKFRIGGGPLRLDAQWHRQYNRSLHKAFGKVGALSLWINQLIGSHPYLAAQIGEQMLGSLCKATERLNNLISDGGSNASIITESKMVLMSCRDIVHTMQYGSRN